MNLVVSFLFFNNLIDFEKHIIFQRACVLKKPINNYGGDAFKGTGGKLQGEIYIKTFIYLFIYLVVSEALVEISNFNNILYTIKSMLAPKTRYFCLALLQHFPGLLYLKQQILYYRRQCL
eukprot:TRINITY_DN1972_c0_g1_i2.p7 TRINITY_DN1972_c0_g1~~TRINITY_DN1972_c0_g1_i2.p7  ORF type:complete len:120 (+),score=6.81 TRINITY_DN1972_c0_g1_i2:485-844(+)